MPDHRARRAPPTRGPGERGAVRGRVGRRLVTATHVTSLEWRRRGHLELGATMADDMGLGKTIQVLALLEARRIEGAGPSIIVVPRSLVFNWFREAERFAPGLRMLDHSGMSRRIGAIDLVRHAAQ